MTCVRDTVGILDAKVAILLIRAKYFRKELTKYNKKQRMKLTQNMKTEMTERQKYQKNTKQLLRSLLLLAVMMVEGATGAWGQTDISCFSLAYSIKCGIWVRK